MSYLIDTNILSELRRKSANPGVVEWFSQRPATTLYLSVLTLGEIRKGIEGDSDASRRQSLLDWLETDLPAFFTDGYCQLIRQLRIAGDDWSPQRGGPCLPSTVCWPPPHLNTIWC